VAGTKRAHFAGKILLSRLSCGAPGRSEFGAFLRDRCPILVYRQCGEVLRGASLEGEIVRPLDSAVPLTAIRWNDMLGCMVMGLVIVEALA
jgi:hypothetical protein